jgi:ABC-type dipeptide/oligopeptide/nickel transport system permease subunit
VTFIHDLPRWLVGTSTVALFVLGSLGGLVAVLATLIGLAIGLAAGFVRLLDAVLMRVMDGLMSIPPILLAIALMALTRASVQNVIIAISIADFPRVSRLIRGVVLTLREQPYVEAAIASGDGLENVTPPSHMENCMPKCSHLELK